MCHHGNSGGHQGRDNRGLRGSTFELHGLAARLLENAPGAFDRLVGAQVIAGERHIDDHQRVMHGSAYHLGVVDHLVERHRQGVGMALHDHRHAVANQNPLDAGGIEQRGHRVVIGREHRDLLTRRLHGGEFGNRDATRFVGHGRLGPGGSAGWWLLLGIVVFGPANGNGQPFALPVPQSILNVGQGLFCATARQPDQAPGKAP